MAREPHTPTPLPPGFEHLQGAVDYANIMTAPRRTLVIMALVESMVRAGLALVNAGTDEVDTVRRALEQRLSALQSAIGQLENERNTAVNERAALRDALIAAVEWWHDNPRNFERAEPAWLPAARAALALGEA